MCVGVMRDWVPWGTGTPKNTHEFVLLNKRDVCKNGQERQDICQPQKDRKNEFIFYL
jgi:hypothetical protein